MARLSAVSRSSTEAKFAQLCAYIATNAAKWARDMLTMPKDHNQPVDAKTVKRFTDEMRARLDAWTRCPAGKPLSASFSRRPGSALFY